jgi:hypothetical protein
MRTLVLVLSMIACGLACPKEGHAEWVELGSGQPGGWGRGIGAGPAVQVEQQEGRLVVRIRLRGFEREALPGSRFERLVLPGVATLREGGRPALPVVGIPLLVDGEAEVVAVRGRWVSFEGVVPEPYTVRPKRCGAAVWRQTCDEALYSAPGPYPERMVEVSQRGTLRGLSALLLEVHPFRYMPSLRRLEVAESLEIELAGRLAGERPERLASREYTRQSEGGFLTLGDGSREDEGPEGMLAIVHDSLVGSMDGFVEWKRGRGIEVTVVPLSEVGNGYQQVQGAIADAYAGWDRAPTYVLLVGDGEGAGKVPFVPSPFGCASDFLYSTLEGDDLYSDVLVGRVSAHTVAEALVQLDKAVWYEKAIEEEGASDWLSRSVCISSSEGAGGSNDDVRSDVICGLMSQHGYSPTDKLYHSKGTDKATAITGVINDGRGWVTYLGHGSGGAWATTVPEYTTAMVKQLANPYRLPFVVDISCSNGQFEAAGGDCFAEGWMKTGGPGDLRAGLAIYSATTPTAWDEPAEMAIGFTKAVLESGVRSWGGAAAAGRSYMMKVLPGGGLSEVCHQYVVFGDPSLMLRTGKARPLAVDHPALVPLGGVEVPVAVSSDEGPVAGATVVLDLGKGGLVVAKSGPDGTAALWVEASEVGTATLTVTAPDCLAYSGTVELEVPGCGLVTAKPVVAPCASEVFVVVHDADLNSNPALAETVTVQAKAVPGGGSMALVLKEEGEDSGKFSSPLVLDPAGGNGKLKVVDGDAVTVTYQDQQCEGVPTSASAVVTVDCTAPSVSGVTFPKIGATWADVSFLTDEAAQATVRYGVAEPLTGEAAATGGLAHQASLSGLTPGTVYLVDIEVWDAAGNTTLDDLGGQHYQLKTEECTPDCGGKACGDDGCGGSCGGCCGTQVCEGGQCVGGPGCEESNLPGCGGCACEECVCGLDPFCCQAMWDSLCVGECLDACGGCGASPDCDGKECGPDGCGGVCGECPAGWDCTDEGTCLEECVPACEGLGCGSDGCGGECGHCEEGMECKEGLCLAPCGGLDFVGCCNGTQSLYCEDGFELVQECAEVGLVCGWKKSTGWYDCVEEALPDPSGEHPLWCPGVCEPKCEGKECGPDDCGGTCGQCGVESACENGKCEPLCKPQCDGVECGDDGCDGICGECPMGEVCDQGQCVTACMPKCAGRQCGGDGCGGTCGKCAPGMECSEEFLCVLGGGGEEDVVVEGGDEVLDAGGKPKSGGCSAAGSGSRAAAWLLSVLLGLMLACRRGRAHLQQAPSCRTTAA